jgi:hypothetical protein
VGVTERSAFLSIRPDKCILVAEYLGRQDQDFLAGNSKEGIYFSARVFPIIWAKAIFGKFDTLP